MALVTGSKVLIVEDEYFIATELERFFTKLGATVLGPTPSIAQATGYIDEADAAILDIRLHDELVFPLADELALRQIPFVFYTGQGEIAIPDRFRYASYLSKPAAANSVYRALWPVKDGGEEAGNETVFSALPQLRLVARLHLRDANAADRLVELTLQQAIEDAQLKPLNMATNVWLGHIMEGVRRDKGAKLLS